MFRREALRHVPEDSTLHIHSLENLQIRSIFHSITLNSGQNRAKKTHSAYPKTRVSKAYKSAISFIAL
jgi:hypothetical protein